MLGVMQVWITWPVTGSTAHWHARGPSRSFTGQKKGSTTSPSTSSLRPSSSIRRSLMSFDLRMPSIMEVDITSERLRTSTSSPMGPLWSSSGSFGTA